MVENRLFFIGKPPRAGFASNAGHHRGDVTVKFNSEFLDVVQDLLSGS